MTLRSAATLGNPRPLPCVLILAGALILGHAAGAPLAYDIKPTVTSKMGVLGGTYFGRAPVPARTRHYYIAAEPVQWDFMPIGSDPICGLTPSAELLSRHIVSKVRYVQYTDATFSTRVPHARRLGILGPVVRGVVGDYLEITFWNRTALPLSMHAHGAKYDKDSEGTYYGQSQQLTTLRRNTQDGAISGLGAAIGPNARFNYVWYLDENSGPLPNEPSSKAWLYHSHVSGEGEINLGLVGFIVVTDPKRARPDGTPSDVDREMPALFMIFNENDPELEFEEQSAAGDGGESLSNLIRALATQNGRQPSRVPGAEPEGLSSSETAEAGQRHAINGYIYGNLPGLEMNEGERVRWYLFGLGSETDLHTPHWHGLRVLEEGTRRTDTVELLPGSMKVADMLADNPGVWLFHCHVADHMANGMFAFLTVYPRRESGVSRAPDKAFLGVPIPPVAERTQALNKK